MQTRSTHAKQIHERLNASKKWLNNNCLFLHPFGGWDQAHQLVSLSHEFN